MPALSPANKLRRKIDTGHRDLALREILPVLRERVTFPADMLALVHEHGLGDLKIGDVWPEGSGRLGGKRGPIRGLKRGVKRGPTHDTLLWDLKSHKVAVPIGVIAVAYADVTRATIRGRLKDLKVDGLVKTLGRSRDRTYVLTPKGRKRVQGRRPKGAK